MRQAQLANALTFSIQNNLPILITGAPGIGKTDAVKEAAQKTKAKLLIEHPAISDPTDFKGAIYVGDGKADFLPFEFLKKLIEAKELTICFMDDVGQAPVSVQAALMQLMYGGQVCGHPISPFVRFVGATNRRQDKAGVMGLIEPLKSRFASIVELECSVEDWLTWSYDHDMPSELMSFIRFRPDMLHSPNPSKDLVNSPSPRTVAAIGRMLTAGIPDELRYEMFAGAAGEGFASEFVSFLKIFRELPDIDGIIKNPNSAPIPKEPATLYALSGALAFRCNMDNYRNIFKYFDRMPTEIGIVSVIDTAKRMPEIKETKEIGDWALKNQTLLL